VKRRAFLSLWGAIAAAFAVPPKANAADFLPVPNGVYGFGDVDFVLLHKTGANPCGGIAYRMRRVPMAGDRLLAADVMHIDGTPAQPGERMACGSCGGAFSHPRTQDVVAVPRGRI
jgi:hypothetical protein